MRCMKGNRSQSTVQNMSPRYYRTHKHMNCQIFNFYCKKMAKHAYSAYLNSTLVLNVEHDPRR